MSSLAIKIPSAFAHLQHCFCTLHNAQCAMCNVQTGRLQNWRSLMIRRIKNSFDHKANELFLDLIVRHLQISLLWNCTATETLFSVLTSLPALAHCSYNKRVRRLNFLIHLSPKCHSNLVLVSQSSQPVTVCGILANWFWKGVPTAHCPGHSYSQVDTLRKLGAASPSDRNIYYNL